MKKIIKRLTAVLLTVCLLFGVTAIGVFALDDLAELADYKNYAMGTKVNNRITKSEKQDVYKFTIAKAGEVAINFIGYMREVEVEIYNNKGDELYDTVILWNGTKGKLKEDVYLNKGTYYFVVEKANKYVGDYNFKLNFAALKETFPETAKANDNTIAKANKIKLDKRYYGILVEDEDRDVFKFTLKKRATVKVKATAYFPGAGVIVQDQDRNLVWSEGLKYNEKTKEANVNVKLTLAPGVYYLKIENFMEEYAGAYDFKIKKVA